MTNANFTTDGFTNIQVIEFQTKQGHATLWDADADAFAHGQRVAPDAPRPCRVVNVGMLHHFTPAIAANVLPMVDDQPQDIAERFAKDAPYLTYGVHRDDGDFDVMATLNGDLFDDPEDYTRAALALLLALRLGAPDVVILARQDAPDVLTFDDEEPAKVDENGNAHIVVEFLLDTPPAEKGHD